MPFEMSDELARKSRNKWDRDFEREWRRESACFGLGGECKFDTSEFEPCEVIFKFE